MLMVTMELWNYKSNYSFCNYQPCPFRPVESGDSTPSQVTSVDARASNICKSSDYIQKPNYSKAQILEVH